jgi:hypothetical protein
LVLADFDGGNQRELFSVPNVGIVSGTPNRVFDIKWSDDGQWLTYTQGFFFGQGTDEADIWVMRSDGSERRNLSEGTTANEGVAGFSPDAERIVYRSSRNGRFDLLWSKRDGTEVRALRQGINREQQYDTSGSPRSALEERIGELGSWESAPTLLIRQSANALALDRGRERLVLGWGTDSFRYVVRPEPHAPAWIPNAALHVFFDTGLVGLSLVGFAVVLAAVRAVRALARGHLHGGPADRPIPAGQRLTGGIHRIHPRRAAGAHVLGNHA